MISSPVIIFVHGVEPHQWSASESVRLSSLASIFRRRGYGVMILERGLFGIDPDETWRLLELWSQRHPGARLILDAGYGEAASVSHWVERISELFSKVAVCGASDSLLRELAAKNPALIGLSEHRAADWANQIVPMETETREESAQAPFRFHRFFTEERAHILGALCIQAIRSKPEGGRSVRRGRAVAEEIEGLFRRFGVRRFRLVGLETVIQHPRVVWWMRCVYGELRRRELNLELVPRLSVSLLDPEWLASAKTMGVRSLALAVTPQDMSGGGHFASKAKGIALAHELGLRLLVDWFVLTPGTTIDEAIGDFLTLRESLSALRIGDALGRWGMGIAPLYGAFRVYGVSESTPFYDPRVPPLARQLVSLRERSLAPLYLSFRALIRATIALKRDSWQGLARLIEGEVEGMLETLELPFVDLAIGLGHAARVGGYPSDEALDRSDSAFAAAYSRLDRLIEILEERDFPWVFRFQKSQEGVYAFGDLGPELVELPKSLDSLPGLMNRLPRAVLQSRYAGVGDFLKSYDALARRARRDSRELLLTLPDAETPSAVLESLQLRGAADSL